MDSTPYNLTGVLFLDVPREQATSSAGIPGSCQGCRLCARRNMKRRISVMNTTATLSQLFAGIQDDLEQVDKTFQERATSGLEILNSASMHAQGSQGKRLRTAITLLSGKLHTYRFEKLLPLSVAFEMVHLATLI